LGQRSVAPQEKPSKIGRQLPTVEASPGHLTLSFPQQRSKIYFSAFSDPRDDKKHFPSVDMAMCTKGQDDCLPSPATWPQAEAIFIVDNQNCKLPLAVSFSKVPYYLLEDLGHAKSLEAQVDGVHLRFSTEQIEALRNLSSSVAPDVAWRQSVDLARTKKLDSNATGRFLAQIVSESMDDDRRLEATYYLGHLDLESTRDGHNKEVAEEEFALRDLEVGADGLGLICHNESSCVKFKRHRSYASGESTDEDEMSEFAGHILVRDERLRYALLYLYYVYSYGHD
jgi:hypothetical protein